MTLTIYLDPMSQPSRAVMMLLQECNIQHKIHNVFITKGQTRTEEYKKINPLAKVPFITDDEFKLSESCTILRYLCTKHKVADNWYGGNDLQQQGRINEVLDWYHTGLRRSSVCLMQGKFLPLMSGQDVNQPQFIALAKEGSESLGQNLTIIEDVYLRNNKFLCGNNVSIADLICASEIVQIAVTGEDISAHKNTIAWLERVRSSVQSWDAVHKILYTVLNKQKKQSYIKLPSKL